MDMMIFVILAVAMTFVIYRNFGMVKRMKHNNFYIDCYKSMLKEEDGALDLINKTIDEEPSSEFKNKLRVFKVYAELGKTLNSSVDELDMNEIFYTKGQLDKNKVNMNTDTYVWIYLLMAKARNLSRFDVLDKVIEKTLAMHEMENRMEYKLAEALGHSFKQTEDGGMTFFNDIMEGNTYKLLHDKQLIGIYKRVAACMLDISGESFDDFYKDDLKEFARTLIGAAFMKNVGVYDKYKPSDEELEEVRQIEEAEKVEREKTEE